MNRVSAAEQQTINALQANWVWVPKWTDSSDENTAGRIVKFRREIDITSRVTDAVIHFSADTRYKLFINGSLVTVGPTRGSTQLWYYETLDIAPYLKQGKNEVQFLVLRYFAAVRGAMPFARTAFPGFTVAGLVRMTGHSIDMASLTDWTAQVHSHVRFPLGLMDDWCLHINERVQPPAPNNVLSPRSYGMGTRNGDILPWRLQPRLIPLPEFSDVGCKPLVVRESTISLEAWTSFFAHGKPLELYAGTNHCLDIKADVHSTAFLRWCFNAKNSSRLKLKMTYSEGYEADPRSYPFFRTKNDRLDWQNGHLIGPHDDIVLDIDAGQETIYEPFWFRTFMVLRLEIAVGEETVTLHSFNATQANYPMAIKASWENPSEPDSQQFWDISVRTMRNCMFDGYSDCPFYEQLQYSGDSRSIGLFHYLLSGDDRLMRQAISMYATSVTAEGLTQSRFPSQGPQLIASFPLFWILTICDHHLYFGDDAYTRSFLPRIDGVLEFFESYIDDRGLVSNLPPDLWQFVDWVTTWGATEEHPDKGVPTSGRESNFHTFFSLFYAWVLQKTASLVQAVGRPGYAEEYQQRARSVVRAIRKHCYDGRSITDSTADIADNLAYSQHCQVFGVLARVLDASQQADILRHAFKKDSGFAKCSYVMQFYAFRAFAMAKHGVYEEMWPDVWDPWKKMLRNNLTTWEEDDVRQRSDCHAWGSIPIYEFCTEIAGVQPIRPGCSKILFAPRVTLSKGITAKIALGNDNMATVSWITTSNRAVSIKLQLDKAIEVRTCIDGTTIDHGVVDQLQLFHDPAKSASTLD